MWTVYILECSDGTLYTGVALDLQKIVNAHNDGKGAKYTKTRRPVKVLVTFKCETKSDAFKEEYRIKQLTREQKLQLINDTIKIQE